MKLLLLVIFFTYSLFALDINTKDVKVTDFSVQYLEDTKKQYTIETVANQVFKNSTTNKHSFGFTGDKVFWLKTDITINSDIKKLYIQQADTVNTSNIELFFIKNSTVLNHIKSGIENKNTSTSDALMIADVKKGETYTLIARYSSKGSLILNMNILDEQSYYEYKKYFTLAYGVFLGVILALALYNFYLYFALKYRQYLYFSFWVIFLLIYNMTQTGVMMEFFPISTVYYNYLYYTFFPMSIFFILFFQSILDTKHTMPVVDKIFTLFTISMFINFFYVLLFSGIDAFIYMMNVMILGVVFTLVPVIIWALYKKISLINFYSLASLPVIMMSLPSEFIFFGWIEFSYFSRYGVMFASTYEAIAYSILVSHYINKIQEENNLQKLILHQKEKQASLGELLIYITHQWRAPLTTLSSLVTLNEAKLKKGIDIPTEKVKENILQSKKSIKFMNDTINNFTSFYMPAKEKSEFSVLSALETVKSIIEKDLHSYNIELNITGDEEIRYFGVSNDISQIMLSLISNSKSIFLLRKITDPLISIYFYENKYSLILEIKDNAEGIKISPIEKIFEPYVSEKEDAGNGVGLYLVKNILETYSGAIKARNEDNGAVFTITLPKEST